MNINIWSCEFSVPTNEGYHENGYLDRTWNEDECPIDYKNVKVGDRINYRFPNDYQKRNFICRVKDIKMYLGELNIQVEVLNIRKD